MGVVKRRIGAWDTLERGNETKLHLNAHWCSDNGATRRSSIIKRVNCVIIVMVGIALRLPTWLPEFR
jgi:hypothetical protein